MMTRKAVDRIATGVANLDDILGGGLPRGSVTMLSGSPGSGKTILAQQVGFHNASLRRPVLFFSTLSEPTAKTLRHLSQFGFSAGRRIGRDVRFIDLGGIMRAEGLATAVGLIVRHLKAVKPSLVVIDSFKVFDDLSVSKQEMRKFGYETAVSLMAWETTALLLGEYSEAEQDTNPVFSIVDGLVRMSQRESLGEHARYLKVIKMRGTQHNRDEHLFSITDNGIAVFPLRVSVRRDPPASAPRGRCVTGIERLDQLLGPGIPWGSSVLVSGVAGTGKTVLALEFLYRGALKGEKGVFFSFEQTAERLRLQAEGMGWDLERELDRGMIEIVFIPQPDIMVESHILMMRDRIAALKARRVVIDSVSVFMHKIVEPQLVREKMFHLCTIIQNAHAVALFPTDIPYGSKQVSRFGVEETVVDGIIVLTSTEEARERQRYLEIYKLRNTAHFKGRHNLVIEHGGIGVFPRYGVEPRPEVIPPPLEHTRLGTGVRGLDALLHGGILRRSVTMLSGSAGSGKTTMGIQFLLEGARKGERGLYVTPEEGPEQLMTSAGAQGLRLRAAVKRGQVKILYLRREHLRTGQFLTVISEALEALKARRIVLDAAAPMFTEGDTEDDLAAVLYKLVARFKFLRVTSLLALEAPSLYGAGQPTGKTLSPLADNVIMLRYRPAAGRLTRTLTIVKTRGSDSELGTYSVTTGRGGLRVGERVGERPARRTKKKG